MKGLFKYLILLLPALGLAKAHAQTYGNEWIHFSNTYKKFKVAQEGIYRITASRLSSMGLSNVPGSQFALFREGAEVPIYVSTSGLLGAGDYIEFYATKADGKMDTPLYPDPAYQPNPEINLLSDSAAYFLTYDNGMHQRLSRISNAIPTPAPAAAPYCWATAYPSNNIRSRFSTGRSIDVSGEYFYSSDYDLGEGWAYNSTSTKSITLSIPTTQVYTAPGPNATLTFTASGYTLPQQNHHIYVKLNNAAVFDTTYYGFNMIRKSISLSASQLNSASSVVNYNDAFNYCLLQSEIRYPHTFDFTDNFAQQASFELPAGQRYLEISDFDLSGAAPLLYDLTNKKVYTATVANGLAKFYLDDAAGSRRLYLASTGAIRNIDMFSNVQFRDYALSANQGNYIILSHKSYINASPNYLNDYKTYRSSMAGGGYSPVIVDVTELYDQFGYGCDYNPLSIRRFIQYALNNWTPKPEYLFIVGKGVSYNSYNAYLASAGQYTYAPVPTWGHPGSDNLFSCFNNSQKPMLATGRLSAYNNEEINDYLEKVKTYEAALKPAALPTAASELWKKNALHIAGATDLNLQTHLITTLAGCAASYEDTLIGGTVTAIAKNSTDPISEVNNVAIDSLINNGVSIISFYGHASSSGFDYNLNSPDDYHARPRFPAFFAFGCDVAQIFALTNQKTVSENYIHSENGGAIAMIAEDNFGYTNILPAYMQTLYKNICYLNYGQTLGKQYQQNIIQLQDADNSSYMDLHTQCLLFQGDPAISVFNAAKRDYAVETGGMSTMPGNISTSTDSFELKAVVYNLGQAAYDSVLVKIEHTHPGNTAVLFSDSVVLTHLFNTDTITFRIPVDPNGDIGINNYTVKIDANEKYDEISEQNNQATLQVFIYSDNLVPVYPKEFAILHQQDITLKASTLNAFAKPMRYKMEIDTTEQFNSPFRQSTEITSSGGVVKWKPALSYKDSVVYYWRTAADSLVNDSLRWSNSSFIYLAHGTDGWNQSHYYQYLKDNLTGLKLPAGTRQFAFAPVSNVLTVEDKVIYPSSNDYSNVRHSINDVVLDNWGCIFTGSVHVLVIDSATGEPWTNTAQGLYGSAPICSSDQSRYMFEFATNTLAARNNAMNFINNIPSGDYVMIKNMIYGGPPGPSWDRKTVNDWMADTLINGSGHSLYHSIKALGFDQVDQFTSRKVFAFFRKKGDNSYPVYQVVSPDSISKITLTAHFNSYPDTGMVSSTVIGPALSWQTLKWESAPTDNMPQNDSPFVKIYGIDNQSQETLIYTGAAKDTSLAFINAGQYPNIRISWMSVDNITRTSPHLRYWRVLYQPVPEAALNAAAHLKFTDSLQQGQGGNLEVAIENLTPYPMDSMLVKYKIIDAHNISHDLTEKRYKKLNGNDTLVARLDFNADQYPGKNLLYVEANPHNDQPEQYHPNNVGYLGFSMQSDDQNPLLDVTFDGVHILDKDIVSAKPLIKILLKDNSSYMALNDTSLMNVQLLLPDESTPRNIPIDGTICTFFPAQLKNGKNNEARIEYKPVLPKDGIYKLIVSGKDKAGNAAESTAKYEVNFTVENKPSITNVLNYPNPFSTATQFIFTLTGSEIPSQFKIQILTVTGKVVREITKNELGSLHIGRNMTDYRWDGKDQYGQTLGNGVYLYRVITSIRGKDIDHRADVAVDKYFKNGYGKLYIMR